MPISEWIRAAKRITRTAFAGRATIVGQRTDPPVLGTQQFLEAYDTSPGVRAMSNRVATKVGETKFMLTRTDTGADVPRDHLLLRTLKRPNLIMSGCSLIRVTQLSLDLAGDAFWLLERNGLKAPVRFWPIPPHWVVDLPNASKRFYRIQWQSWHAEIPETEIIWMHELSPANPYGRGHGIIQSLADEVSVDEFAAKHASSLFFNRAAPEFVAIDENATDEELKIYEMGWTARLQGLYKAMRPFFTNRKLEFWQPSQQNLENLTLVPLRRFERDIQLQTWGIPPEQLGIIEHCHDDQTDCLTRDGWKRHHELAAEDEIATWSEESKRVEYQRPSEIHRFLHDGPIHHWTGRRVDAMVTPNHRMWRMDGRGRWAFVTSNEHSKERGWLYWRATGGGYEGAVDAVIIPPHVSPKRQTHLPNDDGPTMLRPDEIAYFLGAFIAEGWADENGRIELAQNEGLVAEKMKASMERLRLAPVYTKARKLPKQKDGRDGNIGLEFRMTHRGLAQWLREEAGVYARNKRLPRDVFEWPTSSRLKLLDGLIDGDGSEKNGLVRYGTASRQLADDIQRLCIDLGFVAYVTPQPRLKQALWTVIFRPEPNGRSGLSPLVTVGDYGDNAAWVRKESYRGIVWCVTVANGIFFTRRNGKVAAHGNSNRATIEASSYIFEEQVIRPRRQFLADELTLKLAPLYDDRLEVTFVDTTPRDKEHELNFVRVVPSIFDVNELREMTGHEPLPGPEGKVRLVPANQYAVTDLADLTQRPPPGPPGQVMSGMLETTPEVEDPQDEV